MVSVYNIREFVQQNLFKAFIVAEKPIYNLSKGKLCKNRFLSSVKIPYVGTKVKIVKESDNATYIAKFNSDGTYDTSDFRILCTTDLHIDEDYGLNNRTFQDMIDQIAELKPDLVVLTGDCILSKYQQLDAIQFAKMMEQMGVFWAYVFGNHEAREEKGSFKHLFYKSFIDSPYCLSKFGDSSLYGFGNFIINIMDGENSLRQSLVFFDSGRYLREPYKSRDGVPTELDGGADYVKPEQIKWYNNEIDALKKKYNKVNSMLYLHIPLQEYEGHFVKQGDSTYLSKAETELVYGTQREPVACSKYNTGLFAEMKKNGSQAIFCGHDHCNDFCVKKDGIYLVYNQTGGYNCYRLYDHKVLSSDESTWHFGVNYTDIHTDGSITLNHRRHTEMHK